MLSRMRDVFFTAARIGRGTHAGTHTQTYEQDQYVQRARANFSANTKTSWAYLLRCSAASTMTTSGVTCVIYANERRKCIKSYFVCGYRRRRHCLEVCTNVLDDVAKSCIQLATAVFRISNHRSFDSPQ